VKIMSNWKTVLNDDATDWLLEESNPHVRYFALRWLQDKPETNKEVVATREAIAASVPILKLIERQRPAGYWGWDVRCQVMEDSYLRLEYDVINETVVDSKAT